MSGAQEGCQPSAKRSNCATLVVFLSKGFIGAFGPIPPLIPGPESPFPLCLTTFFWDRTKNYLT